VNNVLSRSKTCIIISLRNETAETEELCRTLDLEVLEKIVQRRERPDPHTFIGSGKMKEIKEIISKADVIVFDGALTPSQHFRLETFLKRMCVDRIGLVLEIFDRHAGSGEAKAQIALARIRYELPFLREWVSQSLSDDRPGFMAGGEYVIDAYYENARRQMKKIEKDLKRIAKERETRRSRRRERGFFLVSICGYTNVGKSTLLNSLSGAQTIVDDRMFSTLSTTTRKFAETKSKILVTDTVGFIRDLPPDLIDAFDATMEEIYVSDCIILLIDISDSLTQIKTQLHTSLNFLIPKVSKDKIIFALNKADRIRDDFLDKKLSSINQYLVGYVYYVISAQTKSGIDELTNEILGRIGLLEDYVITLPNNEKGRELYQWISNRIMIKDAVWEDEINLKIQLTPEELEILTGKIANMKSARIDNN